MKFGLLIAWDRNTQVLQSTFAKMYFWDAAIQEYAGNYFGDTNMKPLLSLFLLGFSCNVMAEWIEYSTESNGDVHFFDDTRVEKNGNQIGLWTRVRYKTSVMGASSYQSLLSIDCSENSETILQNTFYSDENWNTPAMATNTTTKPKKYVTADSATGRLIDILCKD